MPQQLTNILDVLIVLAGLYIGLSSVCSYLNEQIATVLELRGKKLYLGVANLVFSRTLANAIFAHALVDTSVNDKGGIERDPKNPNRPSYVDPHNFAIAFWDELANAASLLTPPAARAAASVAAATAQLSIAPAAAAPRLQAANELVALRAAATPAGGTGLLSPAAHFEDLRQVVESLPAGELKTNTLTLLSQAGGDYDSLLKATEAWFSRQMDRVSGWYKRQTQVILVGIAVLVVFLSGFDTLEIAQRLYTAPALLNAASARIAAAFPKSATPPQSGDEAALGRVALSEFQGDDFRQFFHPAFGLLKIFGPPDDDIASDQVALDIATNAFEAAQIRLTSDSADVEKASDALQRALENEKDAKNAAAAARAAHTPTATVDTAVKSAELTLQAALKASVEPQKTAATDADASRAAAGTLAAAKAAVDAHTTGWSHLIGCIVTIAAVSLGAPFWFDLLDKLVGVRSTGNKPAQANA